MPRHFRLLSRFGRPTFQAEFRRLETQLENQNECTAVQAKGGCIRHEFERLYWRPGHAGGFRLQCGPGNGHRRVLRQPRTQRACMCRDRYGALAVIAEAAERCIGEDAAAASDGLKQLALLLTSIVRKFTLATT